jgi:CBS domain-containing protein
MPVVREILATKGSQIFSIGPEACVMDAAVLMNDHKVGCVVVLEGGKLIGIFSERDIMRNVVVARRDPTQTPVREVMSAEVACCQPHTTLDEARSVMKNRRIRHLPVLDSEHRLCGMVSIGDLNAWQTTDHEQTIQVLTDYLYGRA